MSYERKTRIATLCRAYFPKGHTFSAWRLRGIPVDDWPVEWFEPFYRKGQRMKKVRGRHAKEVHAFRRAVHYSVRFIFIKNRK